MPRFTVEYSVPAGLPGIDKTTQKKVFDVQGHEKVTDTVRQCANMVVPASATILRVQEGDTRL